MGIRAKWDSVRVWLKDRGWSVRKWSDWGFCHINWLRASTDNLPADRKGLHLALAGFNVCVTKYARPRP